jgi:hypothetical protein
VNNYQVTNNSWNHAINRIGNLDNNDRRRERIKQVLQSWAELDDENEQKETLKVIESAERVSI